MMSAGKPRQGADPAGDDSAAIDYFGLNSRFLRFKTEQSLKARRAMFELFMSRLDVTPESLVVDVGVTPDESLADSNAFEQFYPWTDRVTATSFEDAGRLEERFPGLTFVRTDGNTLPFPDDAFDIAYSSAVLEHVGGPAAQRRYLTELIRVSRQFFVAVPNRWFPLELHTFIPVLHWLPKRLHRRLLRLLGKDFWAEEGNLNLVGAGAMLRLFPSGTDVHFHKHRLLGMPSNVIAYGRSQGRSAQRD